MASGQQFVNYVCDQMHFAGNIKSRKMFGEYAIYSGEKIVALVCGNRLFVKPTPEGKSFLSHVNEMSPYPGAKLHFLIDAGLDDAEWLAQLIAITAQSLPNPKPKKRANLKTQKTEK